MSVDAQRFMDLVNYLHIIWSGPLQIVLALIFLYLTMGPSIFAGLAIMILMMPVNAVVSAIMRRLHTKMMSKKDKRMKVINEILNGIKVRSYRKCYGIVKDVNFNVFELSSNCGLHTFWLIIIILLILLIITVLNIMIAAANKCRLKNYEASKFCTKIWQDCNILIYRCI